tara:strand:- start:2709 stop:3407 length:699 start_codon:yes stop_codon:yes gene_type:complete
MFNFIYLFRQKIFKKTKINSNLQNRRNKKKLKHIISSIDISDYRSAILKINNIIKRLELNEEKSFFIILKGFLKAKIGEYESAIIEFSKVITFRLDNKLYKLISYKARSELYYKSQNYKESLEDILKAKIHNIPSSINFNPNQSNLYRLYQELLNQTGINYNETANLRHIFNIFDSDYDLIKDYKKVISDKKKLDIIEKLEEKAKLQYDIGNYKAAVRSMRRLERYSVDSNN